MLRNTAEQMALIQDRLFFATGLNLLDNSLGFLIRNQENEGDPNIYIVFAQHSVPINTVVVPFLFEHVKEVDTGEYRTTTLYFTVIGQDKAIDLAVAVFDSTFELNRKWSLSDTEVVVIEPEPNLNLLYNSTSTFFIVANNDILKNKSIKTTTIENFEFNGPANMIQFLYPKRILLQQMALRGTSGSPVVDGNMRCIGMISELLSPGEEYEPVGLQCSQMYTVLFRFLQSGPEVLYPGLLPRYLLEVADAEAHPNRPNILNSVDYVSESISTGFPKCFLGFYGQYFNQGLIKICPELQQVPDLDGFVVFGFYKSYNLSTNEFMRSTMTKSELDNNIVRIYSPFNPSDLVVSRLYSWNSSAKVPYVVIVTLEYTDKFTGLQKVLALGNYGVRFNDSLSQYLYSADSTKPFSVEYYLYGQNALGVLQWNFFVEEIIPQPVQYNVNGKEITSRTTEFPPFALGNERVGNVWNMTTEYEPYQASLLVDWAAFSQFATQYLVMVGGLTEEQKREQERQRQKRARIDQYKAKYRELEQNRISWEKTGHPAPWAEFNYKINNWLNVEYEDVCREALMEIQKEDEQQREAERQAFNQRALENAEKASGQLGCCIL